MKDRNPTTDGEVHSTEYDVESRGSLSFTIVRSVSAVTGDAPETIEPLYETIDPDALDDVIGSLRRNNGDGERGCVVLSFHGCRITVDTEGTVELRPLAASGEQSRSDGESD